MWQGGVAVWQGPQGVGKGVGGVAQVIIHLGVVVVCVSGLLNTCGRVDGIVVVSGVSKCCCNCLVGNWK